MSEEPRIDETNQSIDAAAEALKKEGIDNPTVEQLKNKNTRLNEFPYGKDPHNVGSWIGNRTNKSRTWHGLYVTGLQLGVGSHTILLFGSENMMAVVATITGVGAGGAVGLGSANKSKLLRNKPNLRKALDKADVGNDAQNLSNSGKDKAEAEGYTSAEAIYRAIEEHASYIHCEKPMSVYDISTAWGSLAGVGVSALTHDANYYSFCMYQGGGSTFPTLEDATERFIVKQSIYNITKRPQLLGVNFGNLYGKWSVDKAFCLYDEKKGGPEDRPFRDYVMLHSFLREIPAEGYPPDERLIDQLNKGELH